MRILFSILLTMATTQLWGQRGYIKLDNDSIFSGFLRHYKSYKDGHEGYELWKTKTDKNPRKIPIQLIKEYAIKEDTFKILHQFKPFPEDRLYFEMVDAKVESRGKVNLYSIDNYRRIYMASFSTAGQLPLNNFQYMKETIYILEDNKNGFLMALPNAKAELERSLVDYLPEKYLKKYIEVNGKIKYKTIPDLIKLYNSK